MISYDNNYYLLPCSIQRLSWYWSYSAKESPVFNRGFLGTPGIGSAPHPMSGAKHGWRVAVCVTPSAPRKKDTVGMVVGRFTLGCPPSPGFQWQMKV